MWFRCLCYLQDPLSVDIQGITNHQMVDIPIATVGGVINTQCGEVIAILYQYAYISINTSIHSPAQLEWYKNDFNDKSIKVGSLPPMHHNPGRLCHPLNIVQGLPRMAILPFLDQEQDNLPMSSSQVSLIGTPDIWIWHWRMMINSLMILVT